MRTNKAWKQARTGCVSAGLACALALLLAGCTSYVQRGRTLYQEGRYLESAEVLARHERELGSEQPQHRAQYATYRGLSMLVLGNYAEAHRWLGYAYALEQSRPGLIPRDVRMELDRGWRELTRLGYVAPAPEPARVTPVP